MELYSKHTTGWQTILREYGRLELETQALPDLPDETSVLIEILFSPINPADLMELAGNYVRRPLPFTPGAEGVGRVIRCGDEVKGIRPGDRVMPLTRGNWQTYRVMHPKDLVVLPERVDPRQAAMLRVNPATASLLLARCTAGDWVAYNAPHSAVGQLLAQLGTRAGLKMIAIDRDQQRSQQLIERGIQATLIDDDTLPEYLQAVTGGRGTQLALDCVAGEASARLAMGVAPGGTLCVYGHLSGEDCQIPSRQLTFGRIQVNGFNLGHALGSLSTAEVHAMYHALASQLINGQLKLPPIDVLPLQSVHEAISRVGHMRGRKILLAPTP